MPIQGNPARTLSGAVEGVQSDKRAKELGKQTIQSGISSEVISEVLPNGSYAAAGRELYTTGDAKGLLAGMVVPVAWRNGEPQVILDHNARRAQFRPALNPVGNPVVEELFLPDSGDDRRVWFRNGTNFQPILFDKSNSSIRNIGGQFVETSEVFWGRASPNHFVVLGRRVSDTFHTIAVYSLNRPKPNEAFPPGFRIRATFVRQYALEDPAGPSFGTISVSNGVGSAANPLRAFSSAGAANDINFSSPSGTSSANVTVTAIVQAVYEAVMPNGDVILRLTSRNDNSISGPNPGQATFCSISVGTLLVNLTRGAVLAAHAADRSTPLFVRLLTSVDPAPQTFACFTVTNAVVSLSHNADSGPRGTVTFVSGKMQGVGTAAVPVLNQYALMEHSDQTASGTSGGGFADPSICYPNGGSAFSGGPFRIIGEFAQVIADLPGGTILTAQRPIFQASRTHVFWAKLANSSYLLPPDRILFLTDLRKKVTANVGTQPVLVLLNPGGIPQFPLRQMVAVRSGLIYAPQGPSNKTPPEPPYNVQFFVKANVEPPDVLNQTSLEPNATLQKAATLKRVTVPAEQFIVQAEDSDLQTLNGAALKGAKSNSSL